jgi:molybdenum cofactor guanylyltransferase
VKLLGAIIAGGRSVRFGSDKGAAMVHGKRLIDHVADTLRPQVHNIVIVGRDWSGLQCIADWPAPDMGPLGGLCGALRYGAQNGFDAVITAGCDVLPIPILSSSTSGCAVVIEGQYMLGYWPTSLANTLETHLGCQTNHSMRHWIKNIGAEITPAPGLFFNINTQADFMVYQTQTGRIA